MRECELHELFSQILVKIIAFSLPFTRSRATDLPICSMKNGESPSNRFINLPFRNDPNRVVVRFVKLNQFSEIDPERPNNWFHFTVILKKSAFADLKIT